MSIGKGILIVVGLVCSLQLSAQYGISDYPKMEFGLSLGVTEYLGDLGGGNGEGKSFIADTDFRFTKPLIGVYYKHHMKKWLSFSANLNLTKVAGSDAATSYAPRNNRGLSFSSRIVELYGLAHISPFSIKNGKYKFYGLGGLGVFNFKRTVHESQETPSFKRTQLMLPVGAGMAYKLTENWVLSADLLHRITFTDYIDGYSYSSETQPKRNDSYYSLIFKVGYILDRNSGLGKKNIGCPNSKF